MENEQQDDWTESVEEKAQRIYLSEIFRQLLQSVRFQRFFKCNYDVSTKVNEETESIEITVMELDTHIAEQRLTDLVTEHHKQNESAIIKP